MTTTAIARISLPVIPNGIGRPKLIAKVLLRYFPFKKLSSCQETTAHLYGFKDWHALDVAIKSSSPRGPFDEDVRDALTTKDEDNLLNKRLMEQIQIIENELKPENQDSNLDQLLGIYNQQQERQDSANLYLHLLAREIVISTPPTSKSEYHPTRCYDLFCEFNCQQIEKLPLQIGKWWNKKVPYQPEVGEALERFKLDPNNRMSILVFAQYWGTLSKYYANVIDPELMMGVSYILGKRWASIGVQLSSAFINWFTTLPVTNRQIVVDASNEGTFYKVPKEFVEPLYEAMVEFYGAYPRVDFFLPFTGQPDAFLQNARKAIKILYK